MLGLSWTSLTTRGPERLVLSISASVRAMFAFLAVLAGLVLCYGVLFAGEPTLLLARNIVPLILFLATLWGALQEDRWTFDRAAGVLEGRYGLLFAARKRRWPLAEMERVSVDRFRRGSLESPAGGSDKPKGPGSPYDEVRSGLRPARRRGQEWVRLLAVLKDGTVVVLDSARSHRVEAFATRGMRIASFCGVSFTNAT